MQKELTHIDLFSGIGGFTLTGEWAGFKTVVFCEKEEFCQKVLQKRFGAVIADSEYLRKLQPKGGKQDEWRWTSNSPLLIPEIRDFDGAKWRGATLLTGGFPCQPFSVAGPRTGKKDDRYLWPEMLRIIKEARPRWVLAENVTGIVKLALGEVLSGLESIGYDFPRDHGGTPIVPVIPACGLNAPHRRYRVWIIAHATKFGWRTGCNRISEQSITREGSYNKTNIKNRERQRFGIDEANSHAPDSAKQGLSFSPGQSIQGRGYGFAGNNPGNEEGSWEHDWHEIAASLCRVDDGVPDRVHRLKALGNAIVPQVAYEILKCIAWIETNEMQ